VHAHGDGWRPHTRSDTYIHMHSRTHTHTERDSLQLPPLGPPGSRLLPVSCTHTRTYTVCTTHTRRRTGCRTGCGRADGTASRACSRCGVWGGCGVRVGCVVGWSGVGGCGVWVGVGCLVASATETSVSTTSAINLRYGCGEARLSAMTQQLSVTGSGKCEEAPFAAPQGLRPPGDGRRVPVPRYHGLRSAGGGVRSPGAGSGTQVWPPTLPPTVDSPPTTTR
jgi:hypothetical protein